MYIWSNREKRRREKSECTYITCTTTRLYRYSRLREPSKRQQAARCEVLPVTVLLANTSCGRRDSPPLSADGALTGPRHGSTASSAARTGNSNINPCGQRCGGRQGEVRTGLRSGISSPMSDAVRRSWASSQPRMWGGWSRSRLGKTPGARHQSGNSGSGMKRKGSRMSPV
jgi:hypothetical protein